MVGGAELVQTGEPVSCKVAAIFQVVDSDEGPMTKREFETLLVPAGRGERRVRGVGVEGG